MKTTLPVVTLDGPAGVGKTTLAQQLAESLHVAYLDTGAMFRCLALKLGPGAETLPEEELREKCRQWTFSLSGKGVDKDAGRQLAIARFPSAADQLRRKKDGGRADALLLALWANTTDAQGRVAA